MKAKKLPPLSYLKEILDYNKDTGIFVWKQKLSRSQNEGDVAGYYDTRGYLTIKIKSSLFRGHRLAFYMTTGIDPGCLVVDHKDRNKSNNCFSNLRLANQSVNGHNQSKQCIYMDKRTGRWRAAITINKVYRHIGMFANVFDALCAYYTVKNKYV
jgi:hypothetical protein